MSSLSAKLKAVKRPSVPFSIRSWYDSLDDEDKAAVWAALQDADLKTYTIFGYFREAGLRASKDSFVALRNGVLAGTHTKEDLNVSE